MHAEKALSKYSWPGNVLELQNCIERAVILCETPEIQPRHLNLFTDRYGSGREIQDPWDLLDLSGSLEEASVRIHAEFERHKLSQVLHEVKGDRELAATHLKISPRDLSTKLKQHHLDG